MAADLPLFYYPEIYGLENHTLVFPFERTFDVEHATEWMQHHWFHSMTLSAIYVLLIHVGQRLMENRKPLSLRGSLAFWNLGLAIFSILGAIRMTPEFFWSINVKGFQYSICSASFSQGVSGFWAAMFTWSKAVELLDTGFIVLRKRPLLFLHWYHHITVLMYAWHGYKDHMASARWFAWMNYVVHAIMYSYYALRSFNIRVPKAVSMTVTVLQIVQMIIGLAIAVIAYRLKRLGVACQQTDANLYVSLTLYFTYFLLFINFFYHAYVKKPIGRHAAMRKPSKPTVEMNGHSKANGEMVKKNGVVNQNDVNHYDQKDKKRV